MLTNRECQVENSFRIYPDNWLTPTNFQQFFDKEQPLVVDLGSGKARFLLAYAKAHPEKNIFGIERMLKRIKKTNNKIIRQNLANIRIARLEANYAVNYLMPEKAVESYFVYFPDPWPKKKHHFNRLMNPQSLDGIYRTLTDEGTLHFATDHLHYYFQVMSLLDKDKRFESIEPYMPSDEERTDFELQFRDKKAIGRFSIKKVAL